MKLKLLLITTSILSFTFWYIYKFVMNLQGTLDIFAHFFGAISIGILIYYLIEIKQLTFNHSSYILIGSLVYICLLEVIEIAYYYYYNGSFYRSWKPWYLFNQDMTIADFLKDIGSGITGLIVCIRFII